MNWASDIIQFRTFKFKVGDKVKILEKDMWHDGKVKRGSIVEIIETFTVNKKHDYDDYAGYRVKDLKTGLMCKIPCTYKLELFEDNKIQSIESPLLKFIRDGRK
jgi:hypothetical protein